MVSAREDNPLSSDDEVTWRHAQDSDCGILFAWRNDPVSVRHSKSRVFVSHKDHTLWFSAALGSNDTVLLIADINGFPIATTRFDRKPPDSSVYFVSINVAPHYRGKGMGKKLLRSAIFRFFSSRCADLVAGVHQDNHASQRIFVSAGFVETKADGEFKQFLYSSNTRKEND